MSIRKRTTYVLEQGFELTLEPIEESVSIKETPDSFARYEVKYLTRDEVAESPDEWKDDDLFLVNYHRDFHITRDKIITEDDVKAIYRNQFIKEVVSSQMLRGKPVTKEQIDNLLEDKTELPQEEKYWIFPLSCLAHSGVRLSLNHSFACDSGGWDTSHVGIVLVSRSETKDEATALKLAEGLVEEWNMYLSGNVYCTVVEKFDKDKNSIDYDIMCGYYGYDFALEELREEETPSV